MFRPLFGKKMFRFQTISPQSFKGFHPLFNKGMIGHVPSDSPRCFPPIANHRHGWIILPCTSLILRHILGELVSSDLPRRRSCSDEQSHGRVILTHILLIIQSIWPQPSDSPHWLPPIDENHHGCMILPRISLLLLHILLGLVLSDLPRRRSCSDKQSHGWVILTHISLIIQYIWLRTVPSDSSRWLLIFWEIRIKWLV